MQMTTMFTSTMEKSSSRTMKKKTKHIKNTSKETLKLSLRLAKMEELCL
jgi:hypothetical protein